MDKIEGIKKDKNEFTGQVQLMKSKRLKIVHGNERVVEYTSPKRQKTPEQLIDKDNDSSSRRNRECSKINEQSDQGEYPQALSHESD